jgi:hypothetical protein
VAAAVVVAAAIIAAIVGRPSSGSPLDAGLKQSANRLAARLHESDATYANQTFLNAFNLFQHNQQTLLQGPGRAALKSGQFAQLIVYETSTMPPIYRTLTLPGKPVIQVPGDVFQQVTGGGSSSATVQQGNVQLRSYLMQLRVPPTLSAGQTREVLEVFQSQPG